ncbi:MAG: restriction endonuclease subunit S [Ilumatobacter sp.]|uniref:restriction endonuclease subunit S n=1 Tax=Ilumatobacter sp. TaxID=1967498 RepID=UPI00391D0022
MKIDVPLPAVQHWDRMPARRLFARVRRDPRADDEIVTAFRDGQVTRRSNRRTEGFTNAVQEIGYQGVRAGDLVIHSMDGFAGAIGVSDSDGKASPVVHCYQPELGTEPRFYAYLLRDLSERGFITSLAKGIRERSTAFDVETFRSLVLPAPPLAEQRAIADYLDAETARIDALITKKQQLIHLLERRRWRTFDELAEADTPDRVPLRRVLTFLTDGPFGSAFSSGDYVHEGLGVIRLGNIGFAEFRQESMVHLPPERRFDFARYRVRPGDLLVAALGDERNHPGRACVAPDLGPAIVKGKCFCGRIDSGVADAEYVALACSSSRVLKNPDWCSRSVSGWKRMGSCVERLIVSLLCCRR